MKLLYPNGVSDPYQFRDIVRIFIMGYTHRGESSMKRAYAEIYLEQVDLLKEIQWTTGVDWIPDESWKWW